MSFQEPMPKSKDISHLEESKSPRKEHRDFMLSQESIEQFEQAAELETHEEREKLQAMEKQKREFAK
jgi:hypothetical protein